MGINLMGYIPNKAKESSSLNSELTVYLNLNFIGQIPTIGQILLLYQERCPFHCLNERFLSLSTTHNLGLMILCCGELSYVLCDL